MNQSDLELKLKQYQEMAKQDPGIDIAQLMLRDLESAHTNRLSAKEKKTAYLISLLLPPLGLIFAIKFFFSDKDDAGHAAVWCVGLTVFTILLGLFFLNVLLSTSGVSLKQVQNIRPQDVQQLFQ